MKAKKDKDYSLIDNKKGIIKCTTHDGKLVWEEEFICNGREHWYKIIDYNLDHFNDYIFSLEWRDLQDNSFISKKEIKIDSNFLSHTLRNNGMMILKSLEI